MISEPKIIPLEDWLIQRTAFYGIANGERDARRNAGDPTAFSDCVYEAVLRTALARIDALEAQVAAVERSALAALGVKTK